MRFGNKVRTVQSSVTALKSEFVAQIQLMTMLVKLQEVAAAAVRRLAKLLSCACYN